MSPKNNKSPGGGRGYTPPAFTPSKKNNKSKNKTVPSYKSKAPPAINTSPGKVFGAVSTINTAPVSIGNSIQGFQSQVLHTAGGATVVGRDYAFTPMATGTVTGWTLEGGMPLTPCCMPTTILRNFVHMYNKFRFVQLQFHYITSSSTATTGDVVFYFQKDTNSSMVEWTNTSFLPYVLSDSNTVIGPQWVNHTMLTHPEQRYRSTDYGRGSEPDLYSQGDVYLFSKTASTESPGYVIMDYRIQFSELSVNPRAGLLPTAKAQWQPFSFGYTGAKVAGSTTLTVASNGTSGIGGTTITAPVINEGEVYKVIFDVTNSTFSATTAANFYAENVPGGSSSFTLKDGFTCYYLAGDAAALLGPYSTLVQALSGANTGYAGATATYAETIRGMMKLVTWDAGNALQSSF